MRTILIFFIAFLEHSKVVKGDNHSYFSAGEGDDLGAICRSVFSYKPATGTRKDTVAYKLKNERRNFGHPYPNVLRRAKLYDAAQVESRYDLPSLINGLHPGGRGAELGVRMGFFSDFLLSHSSLKVLFSIDMWGDRLHGFDELMASTCLLRKHKPRSIALRGTFEEAHSLFPTASLDFIYIDGFAGNGEEGGRTLHMWWSKLKAGGIFAGHDYDKAWPLVKKGVDAFVRKHKLGGIVSFHVTKEGTAGYSDKYCSWLIIKENGTLY